MTASASGCEESGEGANSCYFNCAGDISDVAVGAYIDSPFLQWRTVAVEATCDGKLSASCAGHGNCRGSGGGVMGTGNCIAHTGQGVDFSFGCVSNVADGAGILPPIDVYISVKGGIGHGVSCSRGSCVEIPIVCSNATPRMVCGIGTDIESVRTLLLEMR